MENLGNFNMCDVVCCVAIVIAVLYGISSGIISMVKPILSVIIARTISSVVRGALKVSDISDTISQMAADKTGLAKESVLIQMGTSMVADTIISVLSFIICYIIIRIVLSIVFSTLRFPRYSIGFKLDKVLGGVAGFVIVSFFIYYISIGASALSYIGFSSADTLSQGFSNSIVTSKLVFLFGQILKDFGNPS